MDGQAFREDWKELPWFKKICVWLWYFEKSEMLGLLTDGPLWFGYGMAAVFTDRTSSNDYLKENHVWASEKEIGKEDDIEGFSQLVPLLLVAVPLLQVL